MMHVALADSFGQSLVRLTEEEQRAAKAAVLELQINPAHPGLQYHKLSKVKDPRFSSIRVNQDLRIIIHRVDQRLLVMYVAHHDAAYTWAERRKVEQHPVTGALQVVNLVEVEKVVVVPRFVQATPFGEMTDAQLLGYGVPPEWLDAVRSWGDEELSDKLLLLPGEAAEALFAVHTGFAPTAATVLVPGEDALSHPDSLRRFTVVTSSDEMREALEFPWDQWLLFLHPSQRRIVASRANGPMRVGGSAGTGKTIVALHRAAALLRRYPDHRVLLTTFSDVLADRLNAQMRKLLHGTPALAERIDVETLTGMASRLLSVGRNRIPLAKPAEIRDWLTEAATTNGLGRFSAHFLWTEWLYVVDAWQLTSSEDYVQVTRLGRKARLTEPMRRQLWPVFESVLGRLAAAGLRTEAQLYRELSATMRTRERRPYDHIVVDEAQDISIPQLRLLAALAGDEPEGLFFAGDTGQQIFQPPFSWKAVGVDIRGRSRTLKVNYRTSQEIRRRADALLENTVADPDGNEDVRGGTTSVFSGPEPAITPCGNAEDEQRAIARWLGQMQDAEIPLAQIGLFVRDEVQIPRAKAAVRAAGLSANVLDGAVGPVSEAVQIATMHLAKGLEFRAVAVMACDDDVLPSPARTDLAADPGELEEILETERQLLYVACTRAREHLWVSGVAPVSEFVRDLA